jgi:hypothetical protein
MLSFADIKDDVFEIMLQEYKGSPPRPALHQPNQQDGDLTRLPAFPNVRELRRRAEESVRHEDDRRIEETRRAKEKPLAAAEAKRLEDERLSAEATRLEQGQLAFAQDDEGLGRKERRWRAIAWRAAGFLVTASAVIYAGYTFLPRLQTPIQQEPVRQILIDELADVAKSTGDTAAPRKSVDRSAIGASHIASISSLVSRPRSGHAGATDRRRSPVIPSTTCTRTSGCE